MKTNLHDLPQIKYRLTFLYLEKCSVSQDSNALLVQDKRGEARVPAASISTLLLGPGTSITHRAIELAADCGVSICWIGDGSLKFMAAGRPLTTSSRLLQKQAEYFSNQRKHLEVVRKMYSLRFPGEDLNGLTIQQLRGREGLRMKKIYQQNADKFGVSWSGRNYDPDHFGKGDPVNQALSIANGCLYGIVNMVIHSMGLSPGLGFVHTGHEKSFVYDIADLYKAEITIPVAFETASRNVKNLPGAVRTSLREMLFNHKFLQRITKDLLYLFDSAEPAVEEPVTLWNQYYMDDKSGMIYE